MITIEVLKSVQCNGDESLFISFPYDEKVVDTIRGLPTRYWDKNIKKWEVPINKLGDILSKLSSYEFDIIGLHKIVKKSISIPNFKFKTKPFEHQIEGFNYGLNNNKWLLGDEQGLGKTKQVIDIACAKKLQNTTKHNHCLIVCGVNGLKWNWQNEIKTHSNEKGWILGQRLLKNGKLKIGSTQDKLDDLISLHYNQNPISQHYFIITNVETFRDQNIVAEAQQLCKDGFIDIVAFDECHKAKNPTSQQGKGMLKIQADTMIAMTGTPLMNQPLDLYFILKWLGYEKHSFYQFKNHYCEMGGFGGYQIMGYKHLDELREQLDSIMLRRLKSDVFDLPDKIRVNEYVEMSPKQKKIYDEVTSEIRDNIDNIKMANNPLAELIRMRQATGYTGILSSTIKESAKLDRMEELVEEAIENEKKVVIFSNWTQMTDAICERLNKMCKYVVITGETKDNIRQSNVEAFQTDDNVKVIVGTIGAIGTGLTLTAGTVEIFMDEPWNMANKEQAEDRCHRIGTTENVTIYTLICKNTIDEKINDLVLQKGAMANALVDGKIAIDNKEVLEYLIS